MSIKRIVSFLPSATELLYEFGVEDMLYGVTHECKYPENAKTKPRVISSVINSDELSSKEIDVKTCQLLNEGKEIFVLHEKNILEANPDLIISQETCEACAAHTNQVNKAIQILQKKPIIHSMDPHNLQEIVESVNKIGEIIEKKDEAKKITELLKKRIKYIKNTTPKIKLKVLAIEWIEPFFTAGHWVPEMIKDAGGENMISKIKSLNRRWLIPFMLVPFAVISWGFGNDFFEYGKQLEIFANVYREVNHYYVDDVNPGNLMKTGINGMLTNLDPYTNYYPESEIEDYRIKHVSAEYGGIGASSFRTGDSVIVLDVLDSYPAQKADLRAGDIIVAVGGKSLKGLSAEEVDDLLKGQSGTTIKLSVGRIGEQQLIEKSIVRADVKVNNVPYYCMLNDSTGYIKLDKFLQNCYNEVHDALVDLKKNPKIKSLVFDLRGNGGGLLEESVNILNLFIDKDQLLVTQKGKLSSSNNEYVTKSNPLDNQIRVAVLVDKHSASASEITAGNFQDVDRGVVIGQRSYGKGLV